MMEQFIIACMPRLIAHFYRQVFVCPQAAEYPFASVDPTQGLHIQDVVGVELETKYFPSFTEQGLTVICWMKSGGQLQNTNNVKNCSAENNWVCGG